MSFMDLAALVDKRADESRERDERILSAVQAHEVAICLQSQRLDSFEKQTNQKFQIIDKRCEEHAKESSADKSQKIQVLEQNKTHWVRYTIGVVVMVLIAIFGAVIGTAYAQRIQIGIPSK